MNKIQSVTGMNDIFGDEVSYWQKLERVSREIFHSYGFHEIRTPILEETALFARGIGEETQVVQKEMYNFKDKGGDLVTMRPEGTAGVVRAYIQHALQAQEEVTKLYYMGPMFRYERPQKGRLRQFHQIGVEVLGTDSPYADADIVIVMDRIAKEVGIKEFKLEVNSLGTMDERQKFLARLVSYFETYQEDLDEDSQRRLQTNPLRIFDSKNEKTKEICQEAPDILEFLGEDSLKEFDVFKKALEVANVSYQVNSRIVRGLDYYEKTAFEFSSDKLGAQSAFCGGGRYNRLVESLGGKPTPGVGFGMGCERVVLLMQEFAQEKSQKLEGVFFVVLGDQALVKARELIQSVRDANVKADMLYESKSMKAQMRKANKGHYQYAVILGENELEKGIVVLKDLSQGEQKEVSFNELVKFVKK